MPELGIKETDEKSLPGEECYSLVGMLSKEISQRNGSASNISSCNDIQMTSTCNFGEKSDAKVVEKKKIIRESDTIVEVETQSLSSSKCKEQSSVKRKFGHLTFRRRKKSLTESVTPSLSSKNTSSSSLTPSSSTSSCTSTTSTSKTSVSKKEGKENSTKKKSSRITTGWGLGLNRLCARTDSCADVAVESLSGDGTSDSCVCTAYKRTEEHHLGSGLVFGHPSENSIIVKDNNKSDSSKQINKLEEKKSDCDSSKVSQESIRSDEASVRTCETNIGCASSSNYHHNNYDEATLASTSTSTVMSTVQVRVSELALALRSQLALTVSPYPYLAKWGEVNDNTSGFWNRLVRNDSANNGNAIDSNVNNSNVNNSNVNNSNVNNSNMNNSNNATINSTTSNSTCSSNSNQISHVNSDFDADHNVSNMNRSESMSTSEVDMSSIAAQQQVHTQIDYIHCLVPDLLQITNCSFYWGKMDRYEAEKLLENRPEGTFLLRDSAQEEHLFSVSFRRFDRSLHARIEQWSHRFSFDSHDPGVFSSPTVCGLIEHYKDPSHCMFFEPMLTIPLNRNNAFSLQHTARAVICSHLTYDTIQTLQLPKRIKNYLKEYHYKQQVRVRRLDGDGDH